MTYKHALKITKVNKRSKFRIIPVEDLGVWETTINTIVKCLNNQNNEIKTHYDCAEELDQLSEHILAVRM